MDSRPNFIFIHTDQHRADCLGIEGRRGLYTPNLDYLATSGVRFTSAYSTCPVCIPQRLTLLSGQLASTHGVLNNVGIPDFPLENSMPNVLSAGGYQTALVGRGFHTYPSTNPVGFEYYRPGDPSSELKGSFDLFFRDLMDKTGKDPDYYYANGSENNSCIGNPFHLPNELHHTQWSTDQALEFLKIRDKSRPFFLSVGYYAPHGPQNPPAEFFNRYYYGGHELDDPAIGEWEIPPVANWNPNTGSYVRLEGELLRNCRAGYYGNISFIDLQIGRLLSKLMMMRNTYIIFSADHGEMLGDHYLYHKSRPYQGAAHIPFLFAGPGITPLQVCDRPVGWHDVMPTVLELAGIECPDSVDGSSLVPLLKGDGTEIWRDYLHGECSAAAFNNRTMPRLPGQQVEGNLAYEPGWHFLTDGKTKYIWFTQSGREQLFDLINDKDEKNDLSQEAGWQGCLSQWRRQLARVLKGRPEGFSDGEQLQAGCEYGSLMPEALALVNQRLSEGRDIIYYRPAKKSD